MLHNSCVWVDEFVFRAYRLIGFCLLLLTFVYIVRIVLIDSAIIRKFCNKLLLLC